jgi:hypothetical protein
MTVKELIDQLNQLDPDLHVFVNGYEGGFHYAEISEIKNICLNVNTAWYYGPHDDPKMCSNDPNSYEQVKGIVL